ncbi:hypothetical protein TWF718_009572 [Orbilia javanica]|uniref:Uncharacterized protein n=1 Tax=Orbilia javanica TaxID=47235 RepID=A0AAN8MQ21_9PEZI
MTYPEEEYLEREAEAWRLYANRSSRTPRPETHDTVSNTPVDRRDSRPDEDESSTETPPHSPSGIDLYNFDFTLLGFKTPTFTRPSSPQEGVEEGTEQSFPILSGYTTFLSQLGFPSEPPQALSPEEIRDRDSDWIIPPLTDDSSGSDPGRSQSQSSPTKESHERDNHYQFQNHYLLFEGGYTGITPEVEIERGYDILNRVTGFLDTDDDGNRQKESTSSTDSEAQFLDTTTVEYFDGRRNLANFNTTFQAYGNADRRKRPESFQDTKDRSDGEPPAKRPRGRPRTRPLPLDAEGNPIQPSRKTTPPKSVTPTKYHRTSPAQILIHHTYGQPTRCLSEDEDRSFFARLQEISKNHPQSKIRCSPVSAVDGLDKKLEIFRQIFNYEFYKDMAISFVGDYFVRTVEGLWFAFSARAERFRILKKSDGEIFKILQSGKALTGSYLNTTATIAMTIRQQEKERLENIAGGSVATSTEPIVAS